MQLGTWIMVFVCIAWFVLFGYFTARDLRTETTKKEMLQNGQELDPFLFSGEKARAEAREQYETDPFAKKYFDENGITPYLTRKE